MKLLALVLLLVTLPAHADYPAQRYKAERMKTAGKILLGVGGATLGGAVLSLLVGGSIALGNSIGCSTVNYLASAHSSCPDPHTDQWFGASAGLVSLGVPVLATGIALFAIGKRDARQLDADEYERRGRDFQLRGISAAPIIDRGVATGGFVQVSARF